MYQFFFRDWQFHLFQLVFKENALIMISLSSHWQISVHFSGFIILRSISNIVSLCDKDFKAFAHIERNIQIHNMWICVNNFTDKINMRKVIYLLLITYLHCIILFSDLLCLAGDWDGSLFMTKMSCFQKRWVTMWWRSILIIL